MKKTQKVKNEEDSDDYLIELIGLKEDFPEEAIAAYGQIYSRFWKEMLIIAIGVTRDEQRAMDLLADTFNMIYRRAGAFKKGKIINKENIHIAILSWMTTIMKNVFYDNYLDEAYKDSKSKEGEQEESPNIIKNISQAKYFDAYQDDFIDMLGKSEEECDNEFSPIYESSNNEEQETQSENLKKVEDYLSKLSPRDRDIILMTYSYYTPGKNTPTHILDELEQRWGTSRDNMRQILYKFRKSISIDLQDQLLLRK
ncbi:RNA polymerase sigma factor [Kaistella yonginensis]|uniref:RNA polymerase sigma factor n=1 Tax=Kaistella yonginensis TaxID=658267 RepID=UPI0025B378B9|nr:sigma-70 family RNA polymerase sigma factor [Kaistella yonginensis]MDN3607186.1 sigma-70 family RNA polymerase sigma factor [Kaistella yonginensis]